MRLVPECAAELLGADDCAFAVAVASVAFGAEVSPAVNPQPQPVPHSQLPPLDLHKWCTERLGRKDREVFAARVLSFVQVFFSSSCVFGGCTGAVQCGSQSREGERGGFILFSHCLLSQRHFIFATYRKAMP